MPKISQHQPKPPPPHKWVSPFIGIAWASSLYVIHRSLAGRAKYIGFGAAALAGFVALRLFSLGKAPSPAKSQVEEEKPAQSKDLEPPKQKVEPETKPPVPQPFQKKDTPPENTTELNTPTPTRKSVEKTSQKKESQSKTITIKRVDGQLFPNIEKAITKEINRISFKQVTLTRDEATLLAHALTEKCRYLARTTRLVVEVTMADAILAVLARELLQNDPGGQNITRYLHVKIGRELDTISDTQFRGYVKGLGYMEKSVYSHFTSTMYSPNNKPTPVLLFTP